ncbi:MAG: hypothetical protein ACK59A_13325 [Cyanobacteriota bacterium]
MLELFTWAKGGKPRFRASGGMVEGSNLYQVSWRRFVHAPFAALHVINYFADGQTLYAANRWPVQAIRQDEWLSLSSISCNLASSMTSQVFCGVQP